MKKLGKKNVVQDGTIIAFSSPCDCSVYCNSASCSSCSNEGAYVSLKAVDNTRGLSYGGNQTYVRNGGGTA